MLFDSLFGSIDIVHILLLLVIVVVVVIFIIRGVGIHHVNVLVVKLLVFVVMMMGVVIVVVGFIGTANGMIDQIVGTVGSRFTVATYGNNGNHHLVTTTTIAIGILTPHQELAQPCRILTR